MKLLQIIAYLPTTLWSSFWTGFLVLHFTIVAENNPQNLDEIDGYYGPGAYLAWAISTIYVLHLHEWRVLYHATARSALKGLNRPQTAHSPASSAEVVSVHLDISTLITMMYPIVSNIYGIILLIQAVLKANSEEAEISKLMLQLEPVVIVTQVSMALTTPCLFWALIEDNVSCERGSRARLLFWRVLWFSGALFLLPCGFVQVVVLSKHSTTPFALWMPISEIFGASLLWLLRSLTPRSPHRRLGGLLVLVPAIWLLNLLWAMTFSWWHAHFFLPILWKERSPEDRPQVMFAFPRSGNSLAQLDQAAALATAVVGVLISADGRYGNLVLRMMEVTKKCLVRALVTVRTYTLGNTSS